ncbi:hypothetical protein FA13DRAFT_1712709 [Coprinellus micaceus]|uniref:Uncharacterized protein n=1 Tax=Coprinellus micaceus TaxID=71717 RepID=A0A4Y7SZ35_COPMI|nr:hypothetical protein FA13DRAFT_1712709 [Coprinellus micaceus]
MRSKACIHVGSVRAIENGGTECSDCGDVSLSSHCKDLGTCQRPCIPWGIWVEGTAWTEAKKLLHIAYNHHYGTISVHSTHQRRLHTDGWGGSLSPVAHCGEQAETRHARLENRGQESSSGGTHQGDRGSHCCSGIGACCRDRVFRPAPYDVLSVILMCCLDTMDGPLFALYGRAQKHISVTLSQVSQEWWRLALVWGLEDGNQEWCRKLEYRREEVVLWTQRASRSPIKIKIDTSPNELPELNDAYSVQAQAQHKLLVDATFPDEPFRSTTTRVSLAYVAPHHFSALYRWVDTGEISHLQGRPPPYHFGSRTPNYVTFKMGSSVSPVHQFPLSGQQALRTLKSLLQMYECVLELDREYGTIPVQPIPTILPKFTRLAFTPQPPPPGFASSLDLPSLKRLDLTRYRVDLCHLPRTDAHDGALGLLQRFGHQPQVVTLYPLSIPCTSLPRYLQPVPNIISLEIHTTEGGFLRLSSTPCLIQQPLACPMLESLKVLTQGTSEQGSVERALAEIVAQRRVGGAGVVADLRSVNILFQAQRPRFDIRRELAESGVDLHGDIVTQYDCRLKLSSFNLKCPPSARFGAHTRPIRTPLSENFSRSVPWVRWFGTKPGVWAHSRLENITLLFLEEYFQRLVKSPLPAFHLLIPVPSSLRRQCTRERWLQKPRILTHDGRVIRE